MCQCSHQNHFYGLYNLICIEIGDEWKKNLKFNISIWHCEFWHYKWSFTIFDDLCFSKILECFCDVVRWFKIEDFQMSCTHLVITKQKNAKQILYEIHKMSIPKVWNKFLRCAIMRIHIDPCNIQTICIRKFHPFFFLISIFIFPNLGSHYCTLLVMINWWKTELILWIE